MPPKSTSSSQQGGPKQTSLLGFFSKPSSTPSSSVNRSRAPATPATAASSTVNSTAKTRTPASTISDAAEKRRQVILAAAQSSPTATIKTVASSENSGSGEGPLKGKSLANGGTIKSDRPTSNGKTGAGQNKKEDKIDSDVFLGSSPLSAVDVLDDDEEQTVIAVEKEENDSGGKTQIPSKGEDGAEGDIDMANGDDNTEGKVQSGDEEDDQPVRSRVSKRSRQLLTTARIAALMLNSAVSCTGAELKEEDHVH